MRMHTSLVGLANALGLQKVADVALGTNPKQLPEMENKQLPQCSATLITCECLRTKTTRTHTHTHLAAKQTKLLRMLAKTNHTEG